MGFSLHKSSSSSFIFNFPVIVSFLFILTLVRVLVLYNSPLELSVDEAQYWDWSNNFQLGYFSKPPLIAWIISLSTSLFGNQEWSIRLFSPIFHLFISITLWITSSMLFGKKSGPVAAVLWITLPASSLGSFIFSTDTPLLLFWSISLLSLLQMLKKQNYLWSLIFGFSMGLGFLSKYAILFFLLIMTLFWLVYRKENTLKISNFFLGIIVFIVTISPNIFWNFQNDFSTIQHTIYNADLNSLKFSFSEVSRFFLSQFLVFGPISFLIFFLGVWYLFFERKELSLLAFFSIPIIIILTIQAYLKTSNANWALTAYPAACIILSSFAINKKSKFLRSTISLGIIINFLISAFILHITYTGQTYPINLKSDPLRKVRGFEVQANELKEVIKNVNPSATIFTSRSDITRFNYYLNRESIILKNKQFLSDTRSPRNHYEYFLDFKKNKLKKNQIVLITSRDDGINKKFINYFKELELIKVSNFKNSKNNSRKYYFFKAIMKN